MINYGAGVPLNLSATSAIPVLPGQVNSVWGSYDNMTCSHPEVDEYLSVNPLVTGQERQDEDFVFRTFKGLSKPLSKYEMGFLNNLCAFGLGVVVRSSLDASARVLANPFEAAFEVGNITDWLDHVWDNFGLHMLAVAVIGVFVVGHSGFQHFWAYQQLVNLSELVLGKDHAVTKKLLDFQEYMDSQKELSPEQLTKAQARYILNSNGLLGLFRTPSLKAQIKGSSASEPVLGLTALHELLKASESKILYLFHRVVPESKGKLNSYLRDFVFNTSASLLLANFFAFVGDTHMPPLQALSYSFLMTALTVSANRIVGEDKKLNDTVVNAVRTAYAILSGAMIKGVASAEAIPVEMKIATIFVAGALVIAHAISISSVDDVNVKKA